MRIPDWQLALGSGKAATAAGGDGRPQGGGGPVCLHWFPSCMLLAGGFEPLTCKQTSGRWRVPRCFEPLTLFFSGAGYPCNRANADTVRDRSPAERAAKGAPFLQSTCGLVAMTSASHAAGRQFDPPCAPAPCTLSAPCTLHLSR